MPVEDVIGSVLGADSDALQIRILDLNRMVGVARELVHQVPERHAAFRRCRDRHAKQ